MKWLACIAALSVGSVPIGWGLFAHPATVDTTVQVQAAVPVPAVVELPEAVAPAPAEPLLAPASGCGCQGSADLGDSDSNANGTISIYATVENGFCSQTCTPIEGCETFVEFDWDLTQCQNYIIYSETPPGNPLKKKLRQGTLCGTGHFELVKIPNCGTDVRYVFSMNGFNVIHTDVTCTPCSE